MLSVAALTYAIATVLVLALYGQLEGTGAAGKVAIADREQ